MLMATARRYTMEQIEAAGHTGLTRGCWGIGSAHQVEGFV